MNVTTEVPTHSPQRLPKELVESTMFLLKRLGFAAKGKSMDAFEETGLHPYHFGVLIALSEGSHATQGAIAATATGTLMKKIQDQLRYEVSTPPSRTPTAAPLPEAAP